jgi:hypothetical protein
MKLKKGSLEAKRYMAKIRAMKSKNKKKSIGATTYIEQKETKKTKPKKVLKAIRRPDGTFESFKNVRGKIGATKIIESKETKKTNPKKVLRRIRRPDGTFESFVKVKGKISGLHKDTKSHNVKISVMSGVDELKKLDSLKKELKDYQFGFNLLKEHFKNNSDKIEKTRAKKGIVFAKDKLTNINNQIKAQIRLLKKHL